MKVKKFVCSCIIVFASIGSFSCFAARLDNQVIDDTIRMINDFNPESHYNLDEIRQTISDPEWQNRFPKWVGKDYEIKNDPFIPEDEIIELARNVTDIFKNEPSVLRINSDKSIMVVGDLHSNIKSTKGIILNFLERYRNNEVDDILFLGDYTDRELFGIETLTLLYKMKIIMPENIHFIRGNHEDMLTQDAQRDNTVLTEINKKYRLKVDINTKNPPTLFSAIKNSYDMLPAAAIINDTCFCIHGGLSVDIINEGINKIENIERPCGTCDNDILYDLCWNTFDEEVKTKKHYRKNDKDTYMFDQQISKLFLKENNLKMIISGHEHESKACDLGEGMRHVVLLSSENFCNVGNKGYVATIKGDNQTNIEEIDSDGQVADSMPLSDFNSAAGEYVSLEKD